jgi:hypothetical protein
MDHTIPVPVKLLREAHAVMRECGWRSAHQLAGADGSDGVLAIAASQIEAAFAALLEGKA